MRHRPVLAQPGYSRYVDAYSTLTFISGEPSLAQHARAAMAGGKNKERYMQNAEFSTTNFFSLL